MKSIRYHIPRALRDHIDYITPGIKLVSEGYSNGAMQQAKRRRELRDEAQFESDIAHIEHIDNSKSVDAVAPVGLCSYEVTPQCVRGKLISPLVCLLLHIRTSSARLTESQTNMASLRVPWLPQEMSSAFFSRSVSIITKRISTLCGRHMRRLYPARVFCEILG
jgi:hypothetical protein